MTTTCLYLTKTGEDYSRIWIVASSAFSLICLTTVRFILNKIFKISSPQRAIVLAGQGDTPKFILERLNLSDITGLTVARHFEMQHVDFGSLLEIATFIERYRTDSKLRHPITEVWVTHNVFSKMNTIQLRRAFENSAVKLVYIPELPESILNQEIEIQLLAGIPTINAEWSKKHKFGKLLKFIEDQTIAWILLLLIWPILLIIAISIKLESPGAIIFKQIRYGLGGKEFLIWKFRTMYQSESSSEFKQAQKHDPRVTKVGKLLRRSSLDELPQLFNVIGGSMSIVGPRPHPVNLNEQYRSEIEKYMGRHVSKPGITGLAQIKGFRGETADRKLMEQRVKYDIEYIKNWSIFLDLKLLLLTILHLFTTNKAY